MKNILILLLALGFSAPLFSHANDEETSGGAITREAKKADKAIKKNLNKAQKDVNSEICSSGEEECSVKAKHKKGKKAPKASSTSPNAIENKDQAD